MRYLIMISLMFLISFSGCIWEQNNPDYKSVILRLQKNDFYKQCIGHYIVQRHGENQYFYMSDSLAGPIVFQSKGNKAVLSDDQVKNLYDSLRTKSISDIEAYIKKLENEASIVIPFMRENGIFALYGKRFMGKSNVLLEISLENSNILYLVEKDFNRVKDSMLELYDYVDHIDSWLIVKRK